LQERIASWIEAHETSDMQGIVSFWAPDFFIKGSDGKVSRFTNRSISDDGASRPALLRHVFHLVSREERGNDLALRWQIEVRNASNNAETSRMERIETWGPVSSGDDWVLKSIEKVGGGSVSVRTAPDSGLSAILVRAITAYANNNPPAVYNGLIQQAYEGYPDRALAMTAKAETLRGIDDKEAERHYVRAIDTDPNSAWSLHRYGYFLATRNRLAEAREVWRRGMRMFPQEAGFPRDMGYNEKDESERLRLLELAERLAFERGRSTSDSLAKAIDAYTLGVLSTIHCTSNPSTAERIARKVVEIQPQWEIGYRCLRTALAAQGRPTTEVDQLKERNGIK
jgi:tetratricopeptide (TPR) repeat protein